MRQNKEIKRIIVTKSRAYCKHSSIHGVYYFYSSRLWWVHLIWTLIMASSIALCCYLGHMIWEKFSNDPTLNVVETTHYSVSMIPFPAVLVCDTELVYGPKTGNITDLLVRRGYNISQVSEFYRSLTDVKDRDYTPNHYIKRMHFLLEDLGFTLKVLFDMFKKPCDDLLIKCIWRSQAHNCSEMFRPVHTFAGHCCQFDISYFSEHTTKETNFMSGIDISEALDILVSGENKYADGSSANGIVNLYVFDENDNVTILDSYIPLSPGSFFDVNVYVWTIDSSSYVKELPVRSRGCILETDEGVGVSYNVCMMRLILQKVVDQCRCLPFDYLPSDIGVESYSPCNWDKLICTYQSLERVQIDFRQIILNSECYQKCDYVQYDTEVELIKNQRIVKDLNSKYSRVAVHFNDNTCIKYRREVLYTWDQMLANLGGIFGLCLGGSVISVIELLWYLIDTLISIIIGTKRTNIVEDKERTVPPVTNEKKGNKVFTLSNNAMKRSSGKTSKVVHYKFVN